MQKFQDASVSNYLLLKELWEGMVPQIQHQNYCGVVDHFWQQTGMTIRTSHLRDRFSSATYTARNLPNVPPWIFSQTVRSCLRYYGIKTSKKGSLIDRHKQARITWCFAHVNLNHHHWRHVSYCWRWDEDVSSFEL